MHANRVDLQEFEFHPAKIIYLKIDNALRDIWQHLDQALLTKDKKNHYQSILNRVSKELTTPNRFESQEAVIEYYNNILTNLPQIVADHCYEKKIKEKTIAPDFYALLDHFVTLYAVFAKYHYLLEQFGSDERPENFAEKIKNLEIEERDLQKLEEQLSENQIQKDIGCIEVTTKAIFDKLDKSGYEPEFSAEISKTIVPGGTVSTALILNLSRLVTTEDMRVSIKKLEAANKKSDKNLKKQAQAELKAIMVMIEDIKEKVLAIYNEEILEGREKSQALLQKFLTLKDKVDHFIHGYQALNTTRKILALKGSNLHGQERGYLEIQDAAHNAIKISETIMADKQFANSKQWQALIGKIEAHAMDIHMQLGKFTEGFYKNLASVIGLNQAMHKHQKNMDNLSELCAHYLEEVGKTKIIIPNIIDAFDRMQTLLAKKAETKLDFIREFLDKHKLEVIFGGVGGGSVLATIGLIAMAFNPLSVGALTLAGTLFGGSLAGGIGFARDQAKDSEFDNKGLRK